MTKCRFFIWKRRYFFKTLPSNPNSKRWSPHRNAFSIWMIFAQQTQTFQIEMDAVFRVDIHCPGYPNKRIYNNVNILIIGYPTDKNFKWNSNFKDYTIPVVIFFISEQPHCKRFCRCYSRRALWPLSSLLPPTTRVAHFLAGKQETGN